MACITAIETCQRRSHGALLTVTLKGFILPDDAPPIFDALRPSLRTLAYLAIPTLDQSMCYRELYRECPSLVGVDVRVHHRHSDDTSTYGMVERQQLGQNKTLFPSSSMPFKLKHLIANPDYDCGDMSEHMRHLEVVQGVRRKCQKQASFIKGIISAASTLREWVDCAEAKWDSETVSMSDFGETQIPATTIVFPKMRKLSALWCEHFLDCAFPVLQEASLNSLRVKSTVGAPASADKRPRVAQIISKSPRLRKLDILLPTNMNAQQQILTAAAELQHLEVLNLWSHETIPLESLANLQWAGGEADGTANLAFPALHTLGIFVKTSSYSGDKQLAGRLDRGLSELLLMRFFVQKGCRRDEAKQRTQAALLAHDKNTTKMTKAEKKKITSEAVVAASRSTYKGDYEMKGDIHCEMFSPVLHKLVLNHELRRSFQPESDRLLKQLFSWILGVSIGHEWESNRDFF